MYFGAVINLKNNLNNAENILVNTCDLHCEPYNEFCEDDKKELRDESGNMFRTLGYKDITTAINGADALEKLKGRTIGLVLSDFDMDQMGGIDLLKSVRRGNAGASLEDTLFFIYTYNILKKKVVEANRLGVDAYIIKPLQEEVLENKLRPYTITN